MSKEVCIPVIKEITVLLIVRFKVLLSKWQKRTHLPCNNSTISTTFIPMIFYKHPLKHGYKVITPSVTPSTVLPKVHNQGMIILSVIFHRLMNVIWEGASYFPPCEVLKQAAKQGKLQPTHSASKGSNKYCTGNWQSL
jgi:hypothetical protein